MNLNKVLLAGNMTRDAELRHTASSSVCNFGLAINRRFKGSDGSQRDEVVFVDCEAWGSTAENITKYFGKGSSIFVEGRLKLDEWEDKATKQRRSKIKIVVEGFQFVDKKGSPPQAGGPAPQGASTEGTQAPAHRSGAPMGEEDIPF